jgi:Tol biopolymer transport system component
LGVIVGCVLVAAGMMQGAAAGSTRTATVANGPIVYVGRDSASVNQLFTIPPGGATTTQLTTGTTGHNDPSFSLDGTKIAYTAEDGLGNEQVFTIPATGGTPTQITTGTNNADNPTFSPDGSKIAYTTTVSGTKQIWIVASGGGTPTQITSGTTVEPDDPSFSPDGTKIVFDAPDATSASGQNQIFTTPAAPGGVPTRVTNDAATGGNFDPRFSRDGSKIAFDASDKSGNEQIWVISAGAVNGTSTALTSNADGNFDPSFSPDGTKIVYKDQSTTNFQLYTVPTAGGAPTPLTSDPAANHDDPDWGAYVAPTVSISSPADGAAYGVGQAVPAAFSCADGAGGAGLASCVGTVANGMSVDTSTPGVHALTATATDNSGQQVTETVTYSVAVPLAKPVVGALGQTNRTWRAGSKLARVSSHSKAPTGTTFSFTLNEQAAISFAFTQKTSGRRVGHKCLAGTHQNAKHVACSRTVNAATLTFTGHQGVNRVAFQGRITRAKKLKPGRYTLIVTASNSLGQKSEPQKLTFTIVS